MNNQRGGIISSLFIIPALVALMAGFFFLGYYVGQYQTKKADQGENVTPLPEMISKNVPKPEDFTFYKTLTEKENKTVSIELKPKSTPEDSKKIALPDAQKTSADQQTPAVKKTEIRVEKAPSTSEPSKTTAKKPLPVREKNEVVANKTSASKLHYTIQVASYPEKQLADDEVKNMKSRGYAAFIITSAVPNKGTWYRVRLGSFTNKAAAEKLAKDVHAKVGITPIVVIE